MTDPTRSGSETRSRATISSALSALTRTIGLAGSTLARSLNDGLRAIAREVRLSREQTPPDARLFEAELSDGNLTLSIGSAATAALYLGIFLPLAWLSASQVTTSPLDILLLQSAPPALSREFLGEVFPRFSDPAARPFVLALGVLYGFTALALPFVILAGGLTRLVIVANGIFAGYLLTAGFLIASGQLADLDAFSQRFFHLKLAYLMLAFYVLRGAAALLGGETETRARYDFLADGLYGLFAGWLLGRGFGTDAAFFTGVVYLGSTFLALWFCERVFTALFKLITNEAQLVSSGACMLASLDFKGVGRCRRTRCNSSEA